MSETATIVLSSLSSVFSASVVVTGLVFRSIMLNPSNPFSNILFIISVCDCLGCMGLSFGYPHNGTHLCTAQAFLRAFFFPSSWLWSTALVYNLYCMVVFKKLFVTLYQTHIACWTTIVIVTLLPLIQSDYGQTDVLNGKLSCLYRFRTSDAYLWIYSLRFTFFFICVLFKVYFVYQIYLYIQSHPGADCKRESMIFRSVYLYPTTMMVTKCLLIFLLFLKLLSYKIPVLAQQISIMIACQYGFICAIIFFSSSTVLRQKWYSLIFGIPEFDASSRDSQSVVPSSRGSFVVDGDSAEDDLLAINTDIRSQSILTMRSTIDVRPSATVGTVGSREIQLSIISNRTKSPLHSVEKQPQEQQQHSIPRLQEIP